MTLFVNFCDWENLNQDVMCKHLDYLRERRKNFRDSVHAVEPPVPTIPSVVLTLSEAGIEASKRFLCVTYCGFRDCF